jgi:hypothetical protein
LESLQLCSLVKKSKVWNYYPKKIGSQSQNNKEISNIPKKGKFFFCKKLGCHIKECSKIIVEKGKGSQTNQTSQANSVVNNKLFIAIVSAQRTFNNMCGIFILVQLNIRHQIFFGSSHI